MLHSYVISVLADFDVSFFLVICFQFLVLIIYQETHVFVKNILCVCVCVCAHACVCVLKDAEKRALPITYCSVANTCRSQILSILVFRTCQFMTHGTTVVDRLKFCVFFAPRPRVYKYIFTFIPNQLVLACMCGYWMCSLLHRTTPAKGRTGSFYVSTL